MLEVKSVSSNFFYESITFWMFAGPAFSLFTAFVQKGFACVTFGWDRTKFLINISIIYLLSAKLCECKSGSSYLINLVLGNILISESSFY